MDRNRFALDAAMQVDKLSQYIFDVMTLQKKTGFFKRVLWWANPYRRQNIWHL
jgi:hypothetical protein